jgi:hypothetical protein
LSRLERRWEEELDREIDLEEIHKYLKKKQKMGKQHGYTITVLNFGTNYAGRKI